MTEISLARNKLWGEMFFCQRQKNIPFPRRRESLPASAGTSAKRNGRLSVNAAVAAEIPAFAGMGEGGTAKLKELPFRRKPESLRRSRIRRRRLLQCSASRKILAVARMRFRLSPEWKILFFAARFSSFPFPRRRESPYSLGRATLAPHRFFTIRGRGDSRFRGNGVRVGMGGGRDGNNYFHSGESRNLCGEAAFAEGDHCNVPLRGKFSLPRE